MGCAAAYIVLVVGLMIYCKGRRARQNKKEEVMAPECENRKFLSVVFDLTVTATANFTITAEILACSLANFYRQYADRQTDESGQFDHLLSSVFNESVLLLTMNFIITLSK